MGRLRIEIAAGALFKPSNYNGKLASLRFGPFETFNQLRNARLRLFKVAPRLFNEM